MRGWASLSLVLVACAQDRFDLSSTSDRPPAGTYVPSAESTEEACTDGIDNDGDGYVDCADLDCRPGAEVPSYCLGPEGDDVSCSDELDNDGNGFVDCEDFACSMNPDVTICPEPAPENDDASCSDGLDNDLDGFVDCDDFDCSMSADVTVCGGAEG